MNPNEWISQAEAARLRGVSRQAINRLVERGKLTALEIGGTRLVRRDEVLQFEPDEPGRPRSTPPDNTDA